MGLLDRLSKHIPVYRRCPYGFYHRVSAQDNSCGHGGKFLDWSEEYQRWVPNPTKTAVAKEMIKNDDEFAVEREARQRLEEEFKKGNIKAIPDLRRRIMNGQ